MVASAAGNKAATQASMNSNFFRYSFEQPINANAQNGNTYSSGQVMNFDFPIVAGAYAERVEINYNVSFTWTNGTGSAPTVNASCAPGIGYGLFQDVSVTYGNKQIGMHPYLSRVFEQTRGYNRLASGETLANQDANVQSTLYKAATISAGANNWVGTIPFALNAIHPQSPYGFLPMGGTGTRAQLQLTPAVSFTGADPLMNCINLNGNTGTITNLTGTVTVTIWYRDYKSMSVPGGVSLDLTGLPTAQIIQVGQIPSLASGTLSYLPIRNPYPFVKLISLVIDGQSSSQFCTTPATNIQSYRIDSAENNNSGLRVYDVTTGGITNYYKQHRRNFAQDLDPGVLIFDATAENGVTSSVMTGDAFLNLTNTGYPAARLGVQVGTTSSTNIVPRVITWGVIRNDVGIH